MAATSAPSGWPLDASDEVTQAAQIAGDAYSTPGAKSAVRSPASTSRKSPPPTAVNTPRNIAGPVGTENMCAR